MGNIFVDQFESDVFSLQMDGGHRLSWPGTPTAFAPCAAFRSSIYSTYSTAFAPCPAFHLSIHSTHSFLRKQIVSV